MRHHVVRALALAATVPAALAAQQAAPRDSARRIKEVTVISVSGRGATRAAAAVDSLKLRAAPPGTSALKVIEQLPGVNVQGADGFGMYEWANRITMRGFQTQQIGQTFDGVPLGDMSYGNFNGLGIGRAVDPSNLASTTVSQGSGALGTASGNNLGGAVQYTSNDVSNTRGVSVQQMLGDYSARRSTLRLESGLMQSGDLGFKGFISYSRFDTDKWKGAGDRYSSFPGDRQLFFGQNGLFGSAGQQWQDQFNAKASVLIGAHKITAFYDYTDRKESDYMDLSLGVFNNAITVPGVTFGPKFDYLGSWAQAKQFAEASLPTYNPITDASYFNSAQGARLDHLAYVKGEFALSDAITLNVQPYLHQNRGGGDWHAPSYGSSYSPDPIMFRQTQYRDLRYGTMANIRGTYELGGLANQFEVGTWLESNTSTIRRPRWRLVNYAAGPAVDYSNVLRLDFDRTGKIGTTLAYAQNTTRFLDDRLRLTIGAKYLKVTGDFNSNGNTPTNGIVAPIFADAGRPSLSVTTDGGFLPQAGVVFKATEQEEVFANFAQNVNQFPYSPGGGVYNANPTTFSFFNSTAKPEKATTIDAGIRTKHDNIEAGLTVYNVDYRNRLLGITLCPATVTCATGFGNVGSVTSRGIEGLVSVDLGSGLRWYVSGSYNESKFNDDYLSNPSVPTSVVSTKGKFVQDAPQLLAITSLSWSMGPFSATASGRFVDKRYFNYTNDLNTAGDGLGYVPSYKTVDFSARYRLGPIGAFRTLDLQLNVLNAFNESYLSTIGSNGYSAFGDNQTMLAGAARQMMFSISTSF
jgi:iron complex outermembrane receptor protein